MLNFSRLFPAEGRTKVHLVRLHFRSVLAPRCRYMHIYAYIDIKVVHCRRGQPPRLHSLHTRYVKCNDPFGFSFFLILISAGFLRRLESPRSFRETLATGRTRSSRPRGERSARGKREGGRGNRATSRSRQFRRKLIHFCLL